MNSLDQPIIQNICQYLSIFEIKRLAIGNTKLSKINNTTTLLNIPIEEYIKYDMHYPLSYFQINNSFDIFKLSVEYESINCIKYLFVGNTNRKQKYLKQEITKSIKIKSQRWKSIIKAYPNDEIAEIYQLAIIYRNTGAIREIFDSNKDLNINYTETMNNALYSNQPLDMQTSLLVNQQLNKGLYKYLIILNILFLWFHCTRMKYLYISFLLLANTITMKIIDYGARYVIMRIIYYGILYLFNFQVGRLSN